MKNPFLLSLLILGCTVMGCAQTVRLRTYGGPELPKDQIAVLKGGPSIRVCSIDGSKNSYSILDGTKHKSPKLGWALTRTELDPQGDESSYGGFEIQLLPGPHTLGVKFDGIVDISHCYVRMVSSEALNVVKLKAEAGHVYYLYPMVSQDLEDRVFYRIEDITSRPSEVGIVHVKVEEARLRKEATWEATSVKDGAMISPSTDLRGIRETDHWLEVKTPDGKKGWIPKSWIAEEMR